MKASNLTSQRFEGYLSNEERVKHTLSSSSGIASAKRLASSEISASSSKGIVCEGILRLGNGRFFCDVSLVVEGNGDAALGDGLEGKKHLKMPSAWNRVACEKFTHTSIRPGRLRAGSRRSIWFVVANKRLSMNGRQRSSPE